MTTLGVIGASGTLGRVAVKSLLEANTELQVRALVRREDEELASLPRCTLDTGGLFDADALDSLCKQSDVVVNLAARNPDGQETDLTNLDSFLSTNSLGGPAAARAAARNATPLIHFSTVAVYETGEYRDGDYLAETEKLPAGDAEVNEYFNDATAAVVSLLEADADLSGQLLEDWRTYFESHPYPQQAPVYGLTKLIGEEAVLRLSDRVCCIRMSDVYGPGHESRGVITDHLESLGKDSSVVANLDFRATASFIFIQDVVGFIAEVQKRFLADAKLPRIVNLVGPCIDEEALSSALANLAASVDLDRRISAAESTMVQFDRRYSTTLFAEEFASCSITSIGEGLKRTWESL